MRSAVGRAPRSAVHRADETRLSARRTDPSRRCRRHDCGGMSSILGTAGLVAWPYTWPHSSARFRYARLARIEKVIAARKNGLGWADVAYACGFTGQAHLIHDFGTIVGGTPAEFFGAAQRWNFRGADAGPSLADSYNPFIV